LETWSVARVRARPVRIGGWLPFLLVAFSAALAAEPADFVFHNAAVYTVTTEKPWAAAVAVTGDRIVFVGNDREARAYIGKRTQVVDLAHGMLLPGFVDSHAHISSLATIFDPALTLRGQPPEAVLAALRQYVKSHPNEKMVRGGDWILESFLPNGPNKAMLDPILPDRPAVLMSIDGHHMWVNSKTLQLAGITKKTSDPEPGVSWFARDRDTGEPTGFVVEGKAIELVLNRLAGKGYPYETRERLAGGFEQGLPILAASGITTIFDAAAKDETDFYEILHGMEGRGQLTVRVFGAHALLSGFQANRDPIAEFAALRRSYHSDYLSVQMIKAFLDGSENNYTGYMLEPYADRPDTRGEPLWRQPDLNNLLQRADAAGIDVHMHVVGDAAARMALDAIAFATDTNGPRERRHTIAHTIFVHPDDIPRFRRVGAIWQTTPAWAQMSPRNIVVRRAMGETRFAERIYRFRAALDQGVIVTFGSDLDTVNPGAIYKPLDQMEIARTRQPLGRSDFAVMPEEGQRVNVADLIRCYTINGAYMLRMERKIGSIEVGKQADLVVLEKNLFDVSPYDIHRVPILLTMMAGKITYRAKQH
jgi:predicted amidohydrolase YtcJ